MIPNRKCGFVGETSMATNINIYPINERRIKGTHFVRVSDSEIKFIIPGIHRNFTSHLCQLSIRRLAKREANPWLCTYHCNASLLNSLIDTYCRCGMVEKVRNIFESMNHRDPVAWTLIIAGYVHNKLVEEALELFE
eukprot:TRINITY_DN23678_c0_g1_i1.p1 TRINITY_DN23678_c0_g1~~TRINITY_DN23678_c0_g1_i1.p1  ORF type:complete len:137 (+),score=23.26 TRINITY_DN23678_c0_g1_i1:57-467(+)